TTLTPPDLHHVPGLYRCGCESEGISCLCTEPFGAAWRPRDGDPPVPAMTVREKLVEEARFFLSLLRRIETEGSVTGIGAEATYFTSAAVNACYSVGEHLERQGVRAIRQSGRPNAGQYAEELKKQLKDLRAANSDLYKELRDRSVHEEIVPVSPTERIIGVWGDGTWGRGRWGGIEKERILYVEDGGGKRIAVVERLRRYIVELEGLLGRWEEVVGTVPHGE
ncbi:MAG TPA: hypothetical protein PLN64_06630, partial [Candidatus Bipolaricaulis anaerobius]|nr:hypothetical protein [Candidatus Bipolaricaulis anaerobius]